MSGPRVFLFLFLQVGDFNRHTHEKVSDEKVCVGPISGN